MANVHHVSQGECMASIAKKHGYADWRPVYDDACNESLRESRPEPHILFEGDEVHLPEPGGKTTTITAGSVTRIEIDEQPQPTFCRTRVADVDGAPLGGCTFKLELSDRTVEDVLGPDGEIDEEIAADEATGKLTVNDGDAIVFEAELHFGHLDPIETISGVRGRLMNLGFPCGLLEDEMDETLEAALRWFQEDFGLTVDGTPSDETRAELVKRFGA